MQDFRSYEAQAKAAAENPFVSHPAFTPHQGFNWSGTPKEATYLDFKTRCDREAAKVRGGQINSGPAEASGESFGGTVLKALLIIGGLGLIGAVY